MMMKNLLYKKAFPYTKDLTVVNWKAQNGKAKNGNSDLSLIHYHYLTSLNLTEVHDDYVEQFLLDAKTVSPFYLSLYVDYHSIRRVTHNATCVVGFIN